MIVKLLKIVNNLENLGIPSKVFSTEKLGFYAAI